jgi:hypothetical protein
MSRSRSIVALALAVALIPQPGYAAPAPKPAQPTTTAAPAPTTSSPAPTGTGNVGPTTGTIGSTSAPADAPAPPAEGTTPPADGTTPAEGETPPAEGETPVDAVPVEEAKPAEEPPPAEITVPEGPERPAEPTLGNGKFKAKGTGLMIAGGTLLGLGVIGVVTSAVLTRCTDLDNSFACKNRQHNTFAVPATATVALLGAVLLFVGLAYRSRYKRWERWTPGAAKTAFTPTGNGFTLKF